MLILPPRIGKDRGKRVSATHEAFWEGRKGVDKEDYSLTLKK